MKKLNYLNNFIRSVVIATVLISLFILSSCKLKVTYAPRQGLEINENYISGIISPLQGLVSSQSQSSYLISSAMAASCQDPTYVKLYRLESDGTIIDSSPLSSVLVGADARYEFNIKALNLVHTNLNVQFLVKAEGCNKFVFKRAITHFNNTQNIDAKTTVIADVTNSVTLKKLNEVKRKDIDSLIDTMTGSTTGVALDNLIDETILSTQFIKLFNSEPIVLRDAKPDIIFETPKTTINELANSHFKIYAIHVDPNYVPDFRWELDDLPLANTSDYWDFTPSANESGNHKIKVYVGKKSLSHNFDFSKPYVEHTAAINVNNNFLPKVPSVSINPLTPAPRITNSIDIDFNTGNALINCETFSKLAVTETATPPSELQFTISCQDSGIQTKTISFSNGDGLKKLYFWAIDREKEISAASMLSFYLDTLAPTAIVSIAKNTLAGGSIVPITINATDAGTGIETLELYSLNPDGTTYALITTLAPGTTNYSWTVPLENRSNVLLKLVATDFSGLSTTAYTTSFLIDSIAPTAPILILNSGAFSKLAEVSMKVSTCVDIASILISEINVKPSSNAIGWQDCSTVPSSLKYNVTGEGDHKLYAWAKDASGNVASSAEFVEMILDTIKPSITVTSPLALKGNISNGEISWRFTEANVLVGSTFSVELWDNTNTSIGSSSKVAVAGINTNQLYSINNFIIPNIDISSAKISVTYVDAAGNSQTAYSNPFFIATTPPVVVELTANNNLDFTVTPYIPVSMRATSTLVNITHFCLKTNSSVPDLLSSCWLKFDAPKPDVKLSTDVSFSDYIHALSFTPGTFTLYSWVKDLAGNISNTKVLVTPLSIKVETSIPPSINNILVTNTSTPSDPVTSTEKDFPSMQPAYIKWKVTGPNPSTITLSYKTNSGISLIEAGLVNGSNGGCVIDEPMSTMDNGSTGCYVINLPLPGYFSIIVKATDSHGISTQTLSYPLNTPTVKFLAGNTESGIGSSALSAIFKISPSWTDVGSIVVTTDGRFFMRDRSLGLVMVDPKDGILRQIIPITGTANDDGPTGVDVKDATLCRGEKIALDFKDNILIFDCTKIRRITTALNGDMKIETIIGGGLLPQDDAPTPALSFNIEQPWTEWDYDLIAKGVPFFALPNGDIYFEAGPYYNSVNGGFRIRKYQQSDNQVYSFSPTGMWKDAGDPTHIEEDIADTQIGGGQSSFGFVYNESNSQISKVIMKAIRYYPGDQGGIYVNVNPVSFATELQNYKNAGQTDFFIQGMDGKLYVHDARNGIFYSFTDGVFKNLIGGGQVDNDGNLMGASVANCPDDTLAIDCKINEGFSGFDAFVSATGQIYFIDYLGIIRIVLPDGKVRRIMGNSSSAGDGGLATEARLNTVDWVDQANDGEIFFSDSVENRIRKFKIDEAVTLHALQDFNNKFLLNRANKDIYSQYYQDIVLLAYPLTEPPLIEPSWASIATATTNYPNSEAIDELNEPDQILGFDGSSTLLFTMLPEYTEEKKWRDYKLASFNITNSTITQLTNHFGYESDFCEDTDPLSDCSVPSYNLARAQYDNSDIMNPRWIMLKNYTKRIVALKPSVSLTTVAELPMNAKSFSYRTDGVDQFIDYCATNGSLNTYHVNSVTEPKNVTHDLKINGLTCDGHTMNYNPATRTLIFPSRHNGLSAIIEFILP